MTTTTTTTAAAAAAAIAASSLHDVRKRSFLTGFAFGAAVTAIVSLSLLFPGFHQWGTRGCFLPFRAWNVQLSRIDVVVEIVAHTTHIHLPFLLYVVTHSLPWSICSIFLAECVEWVNNAFKISEVHMYDDPLDDFIQGMCGVLWGVAFVHCHGWDPILQNLPGTELRFVLYAAFYCIGCSVFMGSAWYLPRELGLSLYTIWASLGLRFLPRLGASKYCSSILGALTFFYGCIMLFTETMVHQNLILAFYLTLTSCGGLWLRGGQRQGPQCVLKAQARAEKLLDVSLALMVPYLAVQVKEFSTGQSGQEKFLYPLPNLW